MKRSQTGDALALQLIRNSNDAGDTLASAAQLRMIVINYSRYTR